jgi:hypothetical protein
MPSECKKSDLEIWLRKRQMTTNRFTELIGCSRPIIWKVKRGIAICPLYANRIYQLTGGEVKPIVEKVGRRP